MTPTPLRVRFAPSPTGVLHLGAMRTALFAWLAARSTGGSFILRIEDTDRERYVPGSVEQIMESLRWLGLQWDEGPEVGGPHGPYLQSERLDHYRQTADRLVERGAAYWCVCSPERLAAMRESQRAARRPTRYDRRCYHDQAAVARQHAAGASAVLRQLMPPGRCEWEDVVRGLVGFDNSEIDDSVLLKSDGYPTYHLAVVTDDHLMAVTDVIRAEEWIPSTPKHLALYTALDWRAPRLAHVPNVLAEDGRLKLSKRRGARNILEYRDLGYLPAAVDNAMALMGWSSPDSQEVLTLAELSERFTLDRVVPSAAVFDPRRLDALNGFHIRRQDFDGLAHLLAPWVPTATTEQCTVLARLMRERIVRLDEAPALAAPLLGEITPDPSAEFPPRKVDAQAAAALLDEAIALVRSDGLDDLDSLRNALGTVVEMRGVRPRDGFRVLYIAILGRPVGLPVFDAMAFIGPQATIERLQKARDRLTAAV